MVKLLQTNLGRTRAAHDLAYATAKHMNVDILIISEPNKNLMEGSEWIKDNRGDVAVLFINKAVEVAKVEPGEGQIYLRLKHCAVWCCYISPNIHMEEYKERVDQIMGRVRQRCEQAIVLGDINSKSVQWGSPTNDRRGDYWEEWMSALDLVVHNSGGVPTFVRGDSESFIDVTCSTQKIAKKIVGWKVLTVENLTHHRYIVFEIKENTPTRPLEEKGKITNNWNVFCAGIRERLASMTEEERTSYKKCTEVLKQEYTRSICEGTGSRTTTPYWWNTEIKEKRDECTAIRRRLTRTMKNSHGNEEAVIPIKELLRRKRKELRNLIKQSKKTLWDTLLKEVDEDIWGGGYKIVTRVLRNTVPYSIPIDFKKAIVQELFKKGKKDAPAQRSADEIEFFTEEELNCAVDGMKNGKAPGIDGIPTEALKQVVAIKPLWLLEIMNSLLESQDFPCEWKVAKVVLIPKRGKDLDDPSAYRPLCLLNTISKLYEAMLRNRLNNEIEVNGGLAANQYGFRKGRSTIHAVEAVKRNVEQCKAKWLVLITLDVRNAFNTADWDLIITKLTRIGVSRYLINIIANYLSNRKLQIAKGETTEIVAGVPQGSVLGPVLWNILFDDIFKLKLTEHSKIIGYADDLALMVAADQEHILVGKVNENLRRVNKWLRENSLQLAPEKTEAIILKGKRKREHLCFRVESTKITPVKTLKYLGMILDQRLYFGEHLKYACKKAGERAGLVTKLMPNIGGPSSSRRMLLCGLVHSILLYGAPVWCGVLDKKIYRSMLERQQRKVLIRVASAFRTASAEALQVVVGAVPIDLLAQERKYMHENGGVETRKRARKDVMENWQRRWNNLERAAHWTKRLIPDIKVWLHCRFKRLDYYLTQALTGHGVYRAYAKRFGKDTSDQCMYCGDEDTVQHTIFECPRWHTVRTQTYAELGQKLHPESLIQEMISSKDRWNKIHYMITIIMKNKEIEERKRQAGQDPRDRDRSNNQVENGE